MDEETARAAATDEAFLSSLLEMGDTVLDLLTLGWNGALNAIGKAAAKSGSKNKTVKALGGYLLNIFGESVQEGAQQGVSIANRNRNESGMGDLFSQTMGTLGNALTGRDPEALLEILAAGKEGAKLAAMFGGPAVAVNTAVSSQILDEFQQNKYTDEHKTVYLQKQFNYIWNGEELFVPANTEFETVVTIAGKGSDKEIRIVQRLVDDFGGTAKDWQKRAGKISSDKYIFDLHWYECDGVQYEVKLKYRKEKKR